MIEIGNIAVKTTSVGGRPPLRKLLPRKLIIYSIKVREVNFLPPSAIIFIIRYFLRWTAVSAALFINIFIFLRACTPRFTIAGVANSLSHSFLQLLKLRSQTVRYFPFFYWFLKGSLFGKFSWQIYLMRKEYIMCKWVEVGWYVNSALPSPTRFALKLYISFYFINTQIF